MRKRRLLCAAAALPVLMSWPPPSCPAEVRRLSVTNGDGEFIVAAELSLRASKPDLFRVLTDYEGWTRLNRNIIESRIIRVADGRHLLVRSSIRACLLFFCKDVSQLQEMTEGEGELLALTVPEPGHLRQGSVRWQLEPEDEGTRVRLSVRLTPDFWLPPLIGPWSMKAVLREQVLETAENLERLAGGDSARHAGTR